MRKFAVPIVLTIVVGAVLAFVSLNARLSSLVQASAEALVVDRLLGLEFAVGGAIFALVMVFFFYSIFAFRRKKGDDGFGESFHGNVGLEIAWTIVPLLIVLAFGVYTAGLLGDITDTQGYDMEVKVTAQQWSWSFEYPDSGVTSTELMLPVDQKILFTMTSTDVIHSFWVPEFRLKQDVVPGIETHLIATPTELGTYRVRCAELCGLRHAYMLADVQVVSQSDFDAWVAENSLANLPDDPAARGEIWAKQFGCAACHSIDGSILVGPSWLGLYGHTVRLEGDTTVEADEAYLHESIVDPAAKLVDDFPNAMPPDFGERLTEDQISDLIAYIKSLAE